MTAIGILSLGALTVQQILRRRRRRGRILSDYDDPDLSPIGGPMPTASPGTGSVIDLDEKLYGKPQVRPGRYSAAPLPQQTPPPPFDSDIKKILLSLIFIY